MNPWEAKWIKGERIGKGGQGITSLVTSNDDAELLGAMKALKDNKSLESRTRMKREVSNLQHLSTLGANVAGVLDENTKDFKDVKQQLYIVTKFIPGPTLKQFVAEKGPLDLDQAIGLCLQVCETVRIAHSAPIVHRDIKPDNIIVSNPDSPRPVLVLVDFGLSFNAVDSDLTETAETFRNKFLDLPENVAPGGNQRDHRSDVTAVCAILYYMLTGHVPGHLTDSENRMPHRRTNFGLSSNSSLVGDRRLPHIDLLMDVAFQGAIENRFRSIDELIQRLNGLASMPSQVGSSDPVLTASIYKSRFAESDEKTRFASITEAVRIILPQFHKIIHKRFGDSQLDPFELTYESNKQNSSIPEDIKSLTRSFLVHVGVKNHGRWRTRKYSVGLKDWQSRILCRTHIYARTNKKITLDEWKELVPFLEIPAQLIDLLTDDFGDWLDQQMHAIGGEILG